MVPRIITVHGSSYAAAFTCEAMFRLLEDMDVTSPSDVMDKMKGFGRTSLESIALVAKVLCEEGNALAASRGYQQTDLINENALQEKIKQCSVGEMVNLRSQLADIIIYGMKEENENEDEEIDVYLEELKKKNGHPKPTTS